MVGRKQGGRRTRAMRTAAVDSDHFGSGFVRAGAAVPLDVVDPWPGSQRMKAPCGHCCSGKRSRHDVL